MSERSGTRSRCVECQDILTLSGPFDDRIRRTKNGRAVVCEACVEVWSGDPV